MNTYKDRQIIVEEVNIETNEQLSLVQVKFRVGKDIKCFFNSQVFENKYFNTGVTISKSLAVVPFVCNVLPLVWLTDSELILEELDSCFNESIPNIKKGYETIYPRLNFNGLVSVQSVVVNENDGHGSLCLFSGGVDSIATIIAHMSEKPMLFSVHGADIPLNDEVAWRVMEQHLVKMADGWSLRNICCHSNFRCFMDEECLCKLLSTIGLKYDWWTGFQACLGLVGLVAPLTKDLKIKNVYIAGSRNNDDLALTGDAIDPRIAEVVNFASVKVHYDQGENNRQEKITHIVEYVNMHHIPLELHVCWKTADGNNCCQCEKCYRTIFGLLAAGADPSLYGFAVSCDNMKSMTRKVKYWMVINNSLLVFWNDIKSAVILNKCTDPCIKWMKSYDFEKWNKWKIKGQKIRRAIRHMFGKIK